MNHCLRLSLIVFIVISGRGYAQDIELDRRVPDEVMTAGGLSLGLGHGGSALVTDMSAIRMNPANLGLKPQYTVSGAYHWTTFGRPFYQGGVVDSQTAGFAAGVTYTGFNDEFQYSPASGERDSMLQRRVVVGLATVVGKMAVGINFQHVSGFQLDEEETLEAQPVQGVTLGLGVSGMITNAIRFGVSGESINNRNVEVLAPRILRAGLAYFLAKDTVSMHLDYQHRQRLARGVEYGMPVPQIGLRSDTPADLALVEQFRREDERYSKAEQMLTGSFSLQVYDMLRVLGAYGNALGHDRQLLAGGLALVNGPTSLAFTAARPYMSHKSTQQAFHVGFGMSM